MATRKQVQEALRRTKEGARVQVPSSHEEKKVRFVVPPEVPNADVDEPDVDEFERDELHRALKSAF